MKKNCAKLPSIYIKAPLITLGISFSLLIPIKALAAQGDVLSSNDAYSKHASAYLHQLASGKGGIGARPAGSKEENQSATFIKDTFEQFGYQVAQQFFSFDLHGQKIRSSNIIADLGDAKKPTIILGAHFDSTAKELGSMGATDNGAGVAAMLTITQSLVGKITDKYNIRFIAFGAEEVGLQGSQYYVKSLKENDALKNIVAMINFDTIAGGDNVYVHSAHSTPYQGCDNDLYSSEPSVRDALLSASVDVLGESQKYVIHPDYPGYPKGETGSWSDHAGFACSGIPIAYVESTNFALNGESGFDGYSQSTQAQLWDCYSADTHSSCNRNEETKWGKIWHTQYDDVEKLEQIFPGKIEQQMVNNVKVLVELLSNPERYLKSY